MLFNIEEDYNRVQEIHNVYDKFDVFNLMTREYISNGRLSETNYSLIGELYAAVTGYVNSTYLIN